MVAAGLRHAIAEPGHSLSGAQALFLGGGVGLFLVADQVSRMWMALRVSRLRLAVAVLAVATAAIGTTVSGGVQELVLAAVLLAAFEAEAQHEAARR
jgi:hypothetical protein